MAREFSGTSQYMTKTNPTGITVDAAHSLGFWLYTDDISFRGVLRIGGPFEGANTRGFSVVFGGGNVIEVKTGTGSVNGTTTISTGTWYRVGVVREGSGSNSTRLILNGSTEDTLTNWDISELTTGDGIRLGDQNTPSSFDWFDGRIAWPFYIQGVALTNSALDNYLNQTGGKTICSVKTDYGPGGAITADALKFLYPLHSGNPGEDISGVGNTLTDTSTTDVANPSGLPDTCAAALFRRPANAYSMQRGKRCVMI